MQVSKKSVIPAPVTPSPWQVIQARNALEGFKEVQQVVFSSVYPIDTDEYENLATALEKLQLNDAALTFQKDTSAALGFGFRCGFLGLITP